MLKLRFDRYIKLENLSNFHVYILFTFDDTDNLRKEDSLICLVNLLKKGFKVLIGASAKVHISA